MLIQEVLEHGLGNWEEKARALRTNRTVNAIQVCALYKLSLCPLASANRFHLYRTCTHTENGLHVRGRAPQTRYKELVARTSTCTDGKNTSLQQQSDATEWLEATRQYGFELQQLHVEPQVLPDPQISQMAGEDGVRVIDPGQLPRTEPPAPQHPFLPHSRYAIHGWVQPRPPAPPGPPVVCECLGAPEPDHPFGAAPECEPCGARAPDSLAQLSRVANVAREQEGQQPDLQPHFRHGWGQHSEVEAGVHQLETLYQRMLPPRPTQPPAVQFGRGCYTAAAAILLL
jgi:hypothetical protein